MAEDMKYTGYDLSRAWFDFCFENPEKINTNHTALFFFCIEHCNRLGWKGKFGLPTSMAMEALGIKSYNTYSKTLNDLISFGFIELITKSKNQYSANVVALSINNKAHYKALDKALVKHSTKQSESTIQSSCQSTGESSSSIDKQETKNKEPRTRNKKEDFDFSFCDADFLPALTSWIDYHKKIGKPYKTQKTIEGQHGKLVKLSGGDAALAAQIVEQSISEGWHGLFELKADKAAKPGKKGEQPQQESKPRNYDENF